MKRDSTVKMVPYLIACGLALALGVAYVVLHPPVENASAVEWFRLLCDATALPGLALLLFGALLALSGEGAFTGIGYAFRYLGDRLIPGNASKKPETYAEYVHRKSDGIRKGTWRYAVFPGIAFFAVGVLFYVLFRLSC